MYRFLLTPRWWGINLFAVLAIPFCLFMGSWQLSRFEARVDSHQEHRKAASGAARAQPAPLSRLLPVDAETSGRTAEVTGRFDTRHPLLVPDRTLDGEQGFYVLSLLRTDAGEDAGEGSGEDGQDKGGSGKALPVVRGWLPGEADPDRVPAPPRGEVEVTGALQASESQGSPGVHAAGGLPDGQLGIISAASLVNVVPYDVHDAWITVQRPPAGSQLRPVPPVQPDNTGLDMKAFQNLGYTAEWFVFAGFVLFMWFRLFRRDVELAKDAALGLMPEPAGGPADLPGPSGPGDAGEQSRSPASTA
ncbi:SURF1 family protein [Streptomyces ovatisporus]|uniref:SURF1-like protein n=1 Tax=Streptomyces ovatisporus TaxID=1128682 RepID=A0ABV9A669_9ACTN